MKIRSVGALAVIATLALGACGGQDSSGASEDGELRTVSIGMAPIATVGAIYAGIEQGFFADHGIELEIGTGTAGAALLPAVVAGNIDFATAPPVSLLQARDQGLDIRAVAGWTSALDEGSNVNVVRSLDPAIQRASDLEGKRVAVNSVNGMGDLTIRATVEADGGDPDLIEFVEVPFPGMQAALEQGQIDAAWLPEPFATMAEDAGAHVVMYPPDGSVPGHPSQMFFTSGKLAESDPELVEDMTAALVESAAYANANPDAVREGAKQVVQMDDDLLQRIVLEHFDEELPVEKLTALGELMQEAGMISDAPDVDGLLGQ